LRLAGTGFLADQAGVNTVRIGGIDATGVVVLSDNELEATTAGGPADLLLAVSVENGNGSANLADAFQYVTAPTLASLTPAHGPAVGGNTVTLLGSGFLASGAGTNLVLFGGIAALDVLELDDSTLTCSVPEGVAGTTVDVLLANANGQSALPAGYRYHAAPVLTGITPAHGSARGGATVTLAGSGFLNDEAGLPVVLFGATKASQINVLDDATLTCRVPAGEAATLVDVGLTNANGASLLATAWRYHAEPRITGVAPNRGPAAG
jgi:hypothetical protein